MMLHRYAFDLGLLAIIEYTSPRLVSPRRGEAAVTRFVRFRREARSLARPLARSLALVPRIMRPPSDAAPTALIRFSIRF